VEIVKVPKLQDNLIACSEPTVLKTVNLAVSGATHCFGDRTFAAAGTRLWNSLPPDWDNRDCHTASSGGHWRHFYLDSETTAQCELLTAPSRNILTCLLT